MLEPSPWEFQHQRKLIGQSIPLQAQPARRWGQTCVSRYPSPLGLGWEAAAAINLLLELWATTAPHLARGPPLCWG